MCVFFTLNRSFYPSTSSTPIILSVPILHPREVQALWSQTYDTEILHRNAAKGVDNIRKKGKEERNGEKTKRKNIRKENKYSEKFYEQRGRCGTVGTAGKKTERKAQSGSKDDITASSRPNTQAQK